MDMLENRREEVFDPYVDRLKALRESLRELKALRLIETEGETYDPSKLLISAGDTGLSLSLIHILNASGAWVKEK